jgi:hypothetical protein
MKKELRATNFLYTAFAGLFLIVMMSNISAQASDHKHASDHKRPADRQVFFGETHLHTVLSFDAYIFGNRNGPDEAYRYAKGEAINHPAGFTMKLETPLDFQAVTDHAIYLGMLPAMHDPKQAVSRHPISLDMRKAKTPAERLDAFQKLFPLLNADREDDLLDENIMKSAWAKIIDAAERHNDPGKFTTLIGYEYTSGPENQNLHRNVFFKGSKVPALPFSRMMSPNPEDLWNWMDDLRAKGMDSLAVPHNSNGSNGLMFQTTTYDGAAIDKAYSEQRMRNEPIVEVTQVKGDSETHPALSPNDEWADFETMPFLIGVWEPSKEVGSYVREAYLNGLKLASEGKGNPYRFGLIGASDTHVGAGAFDEDNYWSKVGLIDATGKLRGSVPLDNPRADGGAYNENFFQTWSASGLAAVWAEENTRDAIFNAMRRKETYATTGPRIRLRFFAGQGLDKLDLDDSRLVSKAYKKGVPMGGDLLLKNNKAPSFLLWAMRDPNSNSLQRVQVVKGWLDSLGKKQEKVFDVSCAGGKAVNPKTQRCPDNQARVDMSSCKPSAKTGADELKTIWRDPDYKSGQSSFYYVRVLENPTCRWSSWDALRAGVEPRADIPATIQERAYSSPIWLN